MNSAYNGVLPKQLCTSIGCRVMHLGGQIILLYLDLHLVIYSNLLVIEGQSSGMQSHRKTLILLLSHVELSALD